MKYEISLEIPTSMYARLIIEASTEDEACAIAFNMANEDEVTWERSNFFCRDAELNTIQEYEGDEDADNIESPTGEVK